jgi:hypothetical protein
VTNVTAVAGSGNTQFTATYTAPTGTVGNVTFGVKDTAFTDSASNANKDTYQSGIIGTVQEGNNQITLAWDTDTTAPTIAVTRTDSGPATLTGSNTATVKFTLSEASADFAQSDVTVTGGGLSNWVKVSPTEYTATFTPTANANSTATIGVKAGVFSDLGNNFNADDFELTGAENVNNKVDITFDTRVTTFAVSNDTNTATEDAGAITGNAITNDNLVTSITAVSQGTTTGTVGQSLAGQFGSLVV